MEKREYTLEFNSGDEERFLVIAYMGHYRGFPKERGRASGRIRRTIAPERRD